MNRDELEEILKKIKASTTDDDRRRYEEWELWNKQNKIEVLMSQAMIPKRYITAELSNYEVMETNKHAFEACNKYIDTFDHTKSLAIFGNIGTGKTHLAIAVCKELIRKYYVPAKYVSVLRLFDEIKASYDKWETPLSSIKRCPFIVLDDIGSKRPNEWVNENMLDLIDYRYSEDLPMLITANADSWQALHAMISCGGISADRIIDRLCSMAGEPVVIRGKSWR